MGYRLTVRDWNNGDSKEIALLHEQMGMGYQFPDTNGPLFCLKKAIIDEGGRIVGAVALRLTAEAYLWLDGSRSEFQKSKALAILNETCAKEAKILGLNDVSAWIPTKILRCFKNTLESLGWRKSPWRCFSKMLE